MRLLKINEDGTLTFTNNLHNPPPYAVLSHTWGEPKDEVSYRDILNNTAKEKDAYRKITFMVDRARENNLEYIWIDTCCIDQTKDAELATAIRSMWQWYKQCDVCFVYLTDVAANKRTADGSAAWEKSFRTCKWFTRGWTLQELIAPKRVEFYAADQHLDSRATLSELLHSITGIDHLALRGGPLDTISFRVRLKWAAERQTSVPEDGAYAMMGICGIIMTPHYGEGHGEAWQRLRRKIIKRYGENALDTNGLNVNHNDDVHELRRQKLEQLDFDEIDSRKDTIKRAISRTCAWVLQDAAYTLWRTTQAEAHHNGLMWIKGKPGAGKSVQMKFLLQHVTKHKQDTDIVISFFFNARGESLEKSLEGTYRSLLRQLLLAAPDLEHVLDKARHLTGNGNASVKELQKLLKKASSQLRHRHLICFVDALDECREQDVQNMVDHFVELIQEAFDNGVMVSVCFSSRHYPTLEVPTKLVIILENSEEHSKDLAKYVTSQKFNLSGSERSVPIPARMRDTILEKANGVFLWVVLVVDILKKEYHNDRVHAAEKKLRSLPQDLTDLFKSIVQRDEEHIDELILCLQWILYAKSPLALDQFYFAMMAGLKQGQKRDEQHEDVFLLAYLSSCSKGLAETTRGKKPKVQFIHESVRDFLVAHEGLKHIDTHNQWDEGKAHDRLKLACLECMQECVDLPEHFGGYLRKTHWADMFRAYPFYNYAVVNLMWHCEQADQSVPQIPFPAGFERFDLDTWGTHMNLLQRHDTELYGFPLDLVYICAERGYVALLSKLATRGHDLMQPTIHRYIFPLFAAIVNNQLDAARLLLIHDGCNYIDALLEDLKPHAGAVVKFPKSDPIKLVKKKTSLQTELAVFFKSRLLVQHFCCKETALYIPGISYMQSLAALTVCEESQYVRLLLSRISAQRCVCNLEKLDSAPPFTIHRLLCSALMASPNTIMRELIKIMCPMRSNAQTTRDMVISIIQKRTGPRHILQMFLCETLIASPFPRLSTPFFDGLCCAQAIDTLLSTRIDSTGLESIQHDLLVDSISCRPDDEEAVLVIESLLKHGADLDGQSNSGNTVLYAACEGLEPRFQLIKSLVMLGANVNFQGGEYGSILQAACCFSLGSERKAVQLLLENGADVNAQGGKYGNALQAACLTSNNDSQRVVQLLLENGADVNAQGGEYGNALQAACLSSDNQRVIQLLLEKGIDVNAQGGSLGNALQAACYVGEQRVVQLLLEKGANVNAQGGDYGNALQAACSRGKKEVIQLLLEKGADVNAQGGYYGNALRAACLCDYPVIEIVDLLLQHGADVHASFERQGSLLQEVRDRTVKNSGKVWVTKPLLSIEKLLVAHGAADLDNGHVNLPVDSIESCDLDCDEGPVEFTL